MVFRKLNRKFWVSRSWKMHFQPDYFSWFFMTFQMTIRRMTLWPVFVFALNVSERVHCPHSTLLLSCSVQRSTRCIPSSEIIQQANWQKLGGEAFFSPLRPTNNFFKTKPLPRPNFTKALSSGRRKCPLMVSNHWNGTTIERRGTPKTFSLPLLSCTLQFPPPNEKSPAIHLGGDAGQAFQPRLLPYRHPPTPTLDIHFISVSGITQRK